LEVVGEEAPVDRAVAEDFPVEVEILAAAAAEEICRMPFSKAKRRKFQERRHLIGGLLLIALIFGGHYIPEMFTLLVLVAVTWLTMVSIAGLRKAIAISFFGFLIPFTIFAFRHWETFHGEAVGIRSSVEISLDLTVLCSMVYAAIAWVKSILRARQAGFDEVLGACNLYMWIATIFACFYTLISKFDHNAFHLQKALQKALHQETEINALRQNFDTLFYFSFVTQTTLGYGDIVPVAHVARALAVTQAIIGQFYVAVVLTYILNLWIRDLGRHVTPKTTPPAEEEKPLQ
jgi:hypothetical protein